MTDPWDWYFYLHDNHNNQHQSHGFYGYMSSYQRAPGHLRFGGWNTTQLYRDLFFDPVMNQSGFNEMSFRCWALLTCLNFRIFHQHFPLKSVKSCPSEAVSQGVSPLRPDRGSGCGGGWVTGDVNRDEGDTPNPWLLVSRSLDQINSCFWFP